MHDKPQHRTRGAMCTCCNCSRRQRTLRLTDQFIHHGTMNIREQRGDCLIELLCEPCVIDSDIIKVVPGLAGAVPDLYEANTAFHQTAGCAYLAGPRQDDDTVRFLCFAWSWHSDCRAVDDRGVSHLECGITETETSIPQNTPLTGEFQKGVSLEQRAGQQVRIHEVCIL